MSEPLIQKTGRRKRSVARVRFRSGTGRIMINGRMADEYFPSESHRLAFMEPLRVTGSEGIYDIDATVHGGGTSGQAGALRLGIARGLESLEDGRRKPLKQAGLLSRDPRKKESKKYGLKKARKAPQYSKR
ncbi:MAG: 30S ribosomal protein S9 [Actinomycetota bacterium]|nr:30S ribosomal protein S9 [Actinomycetota bacterium]